MLLLLCSKMNPFKCRNQIYFFFSCEKRKYSLSFAINIDCVCVQFHFSRFVNSHTKKGHISFYSISLEWLFSLFITVSFSFSSWFCLRMHCFMNQKQIISKLEVFLSFLLNKNFASHFCTAIKKNNNVCCNFNFWHRI